METKCEKCGREFGKRKRCYSCVPGKVKTGETVSCKNCGKEFYIQKNVKADTKRKSGTYCSLDCKHVDAKGRRSHLARPSENVIHSAGYVLAWCPDHPRATRNRVFEHILVMEKALGRDVSVDEHIHHTDHNRQNNAIANLQVMTPEEHASLHASEKRITIRVAISCQICGKQFMVVPSKADRKYCSLGCRHKAWGAAMKRIRKSKRME